MGVRRLSLALAMAWMAGAPVAAQESPDVLRACRRGDLIGLWHVIRFGFAAGAAVDRSDPAYRIHQRYVFNSNATMAHAASATPMTVEEERALAGTPAAVTWALDAGGRLLRQRPGAARLEMSECRVVTQPLHDPRSPVPALPGDVLLTDQGEDARPIARRLLRKAPSGE
ncbi:MAG TPA: hypothetical protein VFV05_12835 [Methylomirabilota bacterium]|nr:hypothetical protein [Methylomirabilota bacterium]